MLSRYCSLAHHMYVWPEEMSSPRHAYTLSAIHNLASTRLLPSPNLSDFLGYIPAATYNQAMPRTVYFQRAS